MAYRNYSTAVSHIVDAAGQGDFTTIAAALTAAVSGQTIFIRPGTYTENPTLVAGVDLVSFSGEGQTPNVIIKGNCTFSTAGTVTISGIQLQTNSANCVTVSGSAASILNLVGCFINCTNNSGISLSSSGGPQINLYQCNGSLGTTGISYFVASGNGTMFFYNGQYINTASNVTASTTSTPSIYMYNVDFWQPITTSSFGSVGLHGSQINTGSSGIGGVTNTTALTLAGSGTSYSTNSTFGSGSASCISIGTGTKLTLSNCIVDSTNTNAITGAGTLITYGTVFTNTSHQTNVTTQSGGAVYGLTQGTAPSVGLLGEKIEGTAAQATISLSTGVVKTITSISLTAGVWLLNGISILNGTLTGTRWTVSISATNNAVGALGYGIDTFDTPTISNALAGSTGTVPGLMVVLAATTTYYLTAQATFTVGTATAGGRLTATRVG